MKIFCCNTVCSYGLPGTESQQKSYLQPSIAKQHTYNYSLCVSRAWGFNDTLSCNLAPLRTASSRINQLSELQHFLKTLNCVLHKGRMEGIL